MPDIGLGEVAVIAVLALLVFGPDRLPKVAADAGRLLRQVRELATTARKDLADAAGLEPDADQRPSSAPSAAPLVPRPSHNPSPPPAGSESGPTPAAQSAPTSSAPPPAVQDWT